MFARFFLALKAEKIPVSLREYLVLVEALQADLVTYDVEGFYYLSRAALIKDERHIDKFDRVFGQVFRGVEAASDAKGMEPRELPADWLRRLAEKHLTEEEKALVQSLGGW